MTKLLAAFGVTAALALSAYSASAQTYPERTITMVVPFAAGGPTDTVTRLVAEAMSKDLGQQIVVENVGGAGGTLGAGRVAQRRSGRLHAASPPHRHGDQRHALPQARLRHAERLRICRPRHRSADDHRRAARTSSRPTSRAWSNTSRPTRTR